MGRGRGIRRCKGPPGVNVVVEDISRPFRLSAGLEPGVRPPWYARLFPMAQRLMGLEGLNDIYEAGGEEIKGPDFAEVALRLLKVEFHTPPEVLAKIPPTGPLVVVSNHPFGGIDGLMQLAGIRRVRQDVRLLSTFYLAVMPPMHQFCFWVDPFGGPEARDLNAKAARDAVRWLRSGGSMGIFPSGEVSSFSLKARRVIDPPWLTSVGRIIRASRAPVLPMFFHGRNGAPFHVAGMIHPRLRTLLLPRQLLAHQGGTFRMEIGSLIPPERFKGMDDREMMDYLSMRTCMLQVRSPARTSTPAQSHSVPPAGLPLAEAMPADVLAREIDALPPEQRLTEAGSRVVVWAFADQIPSALLEIGRLRQMTYREAGEGTEAERDLDEFDARYRHLILWCRQKREIIGAYRLGLVDEVTRDRGVTGLYTHTLFDYDDRLLQQIGPAIEVGRAFVRSEYQRDYAPLMLLWRGVSLFVMAHPQYKRMFGCVSVSNRYRSITRDLFVEFLRLNHLDPELSRLIIARTPPQLSRSSRRLAGLISRVVRDLDHVADLVEDLESEGREVPILIRQYVRLNARTLGFNIDPAFGETLDALMLLDLTQVEYAILVRYVGREKADAFLRFHGVAIPERRPEVAVASVGKSGRTVVSVE